jgi:hypothetical protein
MCPTLWAIARLPALLPAGPAAAARPGRGRRRQVADGFGYLVRHQILLVAYAADFVTLFFGLPTALFPQIAHQRFGGPAAGGAVAGSLFVAASMLILLAAFPGFARYQTGRQPAGAGAAVR